MKNLFIILLAVVLTLTGCTTQPISDSITESLDTPISEPIKLSVLIPFGSPALSMAELLISESSQSDILSGNIFYTTEIVNGADPLIAAFTSHSHDVIIAPTNLGAKFYNIGIPYKYAGAVVYGNLYMASLDTLDNVSDLEGMEIVAFSQNSTPDVVLQTVIKANNLSDTVTIRYVGSVSEAQGELLAGTAQAVILAEPILSVTKTKVQLNIIDLQKEWSAITGGQSYPQAGIYIKSELIENHPDAVDEFLGLVSNSVINTNRIPAETAAALEDMDFGLPANIIESAIPYSHLQFVSAADSRQDLEFYYRKIMELNPALIGGQLPDDDFYY